MARGFLEVHKVLTPFSAGAGGLSVCYFIYHGNRVNKMYCQQKIKPVC